MLFVHHGLIQLGLSFGLRLVDKLILFLALFSHLVVHILGLNGVLVHLAL